MQKNIFINTLLQKSIILKPEYMNKNLETNIFNSLKDEVGDKCIDEGYIDANTIKIVKRSLPKMITFNFSSDLLINVDYTAELCNPVRGNIIDCEVTHINKLGIRGINGPLIILVARQYHDNKKVFENIEVGQKIDVLVIGKKYTVNDKNIQIIGKLTTDTKSHKNNLSKNINKYNKNDDKNKDNKNNELNETPENDIEDTKAQNTSFIQEDEDVSDMDENIIANSDESNGEDMLEDSIEEEVDEESETEDFV